MVYEFSTYSLSCGTTWHAAGLIGQMRSNLADAEIVKYGPEFYPRLEEETGVETGL